MLLRSLGAFLVLACTACHPAWQGDGDNDRFFRPPPSASGTASKQPAPAASSPLLDVSPGDLGAIEITLVRAQEKPSSVGYMVVLRGDGSVCFRRFPDHDGGIELTTRVPTRTVRRLVRQFESADWPASCDSDLPPTAEPPPIRLSLRDGERTLCVSVGTDAPEEPARDDDASETGLDDRCIALADAIDRAVHTERWIGSLRGGRSH
jgi:hypothetical protein